MTRQKAKQRCRQRNDELKNDSDAARRRLVRSNATRHAWIGRRQAALEHVQNRQRQLVAHAQPADAPMPGRYHSQSVPLVPDGFHDSHQVSPIPYEARYGNLMHHRTLCASDAPLGTSSNRS